jgi:hypothetical protein
MKWFTELSKPIKALLIMSVAGLIGMLIATNQFLPFLEIFKGMFSG